MKRGAPNHPKMHDLAERLNVPLYAAVGIMEMLWHYVAQYAPQGDIGRVSDRQISDAIRWSKKPDILVKALVEAHWLEPDEKHRLIVHHWPEHAEYEVCRRLIASGQDFVEVYGVSVHKRINLEKMREARAPMRADLEHQRSTRQARLMAKAEGNGKEATAAEDLHELLERHWLELWALDPYGTNAKPAKDKFFELMVSATDACSQSASLVENRRAWVEHCQAVGTKPLGTLRWFESGDCWTPPPAGKKPLEQPRPASRTQQAMEEFKRSEGR